ncbi:hypothetical protein [Hydrogenophaga taeniospiralis]|uniref:hypothetical protein n=1 Tax=Hydrogenophaga taeniospiralis TaxID=65656 RepID=UPI001CFA0F92|nr:hypothetical protein [Hydrogenophaga taeniospiralis]UCU97228.1 hypothetical protein KI616_03655 [Hydrogenophaga taeniospiralis]
MLFSYPATDDFFRSRIDHMIDLRHPLAVLASRMPWQEIEARVAQVFSRAQSTARRAAHAGPLGWTVGGLTFLGERTNVSAPAHFDDRAGRVLSGHALGPCHPGCQSVCWWIARRRLNSTSRCTRWNSFIALYTAPTIGAKNRRMLSFQILLRSAVLMTESSLGVP